MKGYRGSRGTAPITHDHSTRRSWVVGQILAPADLPQGKILL
jgi:hypothetical protein